MPNKKYYPGYANGSFVAKKQRDPNFHDRLREKGITPTIPEDKETYRLDRFMDLVDPRKGMLGRVANKTPQGDPRNPLMKAVLHAASPTL